MRRLFLGIIALIVPLSLASAGRFPDVPDDHPYAAAIEALAELGVVKGNPDGSFAMDRPVNRAEMLTLLYRASGRAPRSVFAKCFPDVTGWYEEVVCDAQHEGFIQGYLDGKFRPENIVNSVEAIKMTLTVLGFTVPPLRQEDRLSLDFLGITHSSWYAPTLHRALALNLVPEELQRDNRFDPGHPLSRGEAAEMIYRATITEDTRIQEEEQERDVREVLPSGASLVDFPIHQSGKTGERGAASFAFDLDAPGTVLIEAANLTSKEQNIQCLLYLLGESGFSYEFFVGYQEGGSCTIRAALRAGRYQVEVRMQKEGEEFSLDAEPSNGDGNDGFIEAISLRVGYPRSGTLTASDFEDWYRFTLAGEEKHVIKVTSTNTLGCEIYLGDDAELFGFEGPRCGSSYDFSPGTYFISVKREPPASTAQVYTIELR